MYSGSRAGFFLGDGAGVGKGRQIAAMIKEEHARGGKRTLWLSVSNDLRFDAERDLADVGAADIPVFPKVSYSWYANKVFCIHLRKPCLGPGLPPLDHALWHVLSVAQTHDMLLIFVAGPFQLTKAW